MKKEEVINRIDKRYLNGICHRGFHNEVIPENSFEAFKKAIENDLAFEFDIHLSKDNELFISHDPDLQRMTGKEGLIEELTYQEIKDNYRLPNGETIPTLREILDYNQERVPIVIEVKVVNGNYKAISKRLIEELSNVKDKSKYMIISFDPRALIKLKKLEIVNSLLICKEHQFTFKVRYNFDGLDLDYVLLRDKPYQKYAKKHFVNVWTIENKEDFYEVLPYVDTVTYQFIEPEYVKDLLLKEKR